MNMKMLALLARDGLARLENLVGRLWPTNSGNRKVQMGVALLVLLLVAALATQCAAAEPVAQFSAGRAIVRGETQAIDLSITYPQAGPGDSSYSFGVTFIGESVFRTHPQRQQFAWRAELVDGFGRFDVGLGIAYLQNDDVYNSCHANFTLSLAYRFRRLPIAAGVRHFSNGGTCSVNIGRDVAFIGWRFQ
jgi:hypothetical protein